MFSIDEIDGEFDLFLDPFFSELDDFLLNWADNDAEIRRRSNQNSGFRPFRPILCLQILP